MTWKLLVSLVLSLLFSRSVVGAEYAGLWVGVTAVVLTLGYHRNLLDGGPRPPWGRLVLPREESMRVMYTLWGVPLGPDRRVRIGAPLRARAGRAPCRTAAVELLPVPLRWLARRAGL